MTYPHCVYDAHKQPQRATKTVASMAVRVEDVAAHYDAVVSATRGIAHDAPRISVLNNWAKASLIREAVRAMRPPRVAPYALLDLAGGRGGDIGKWAHVPLRSYTLLDAAPEAVAEARSRAARLPSGIPFLGLVGDARTPCAAGASGPYDIVSCQFALNYLAPRGARLTALFETWDALLAPGAAIVLTYANWDALAEARTGGGTGAPFRVTHPGWDAGGTAPAPTSIAPRPTSYVFSLPPAVSHLREYALSPDDVEAAVPRGWRTVSTYRALTDIPRNELWGEIAGSGGRPPRDAYLLARVYAGMVFVRE